MKIVSKHFKPLERQCSDALQITEYKDGKVLNRRGEFGENLPPDFGILEDNVYKVKRKKVEVKQQAPDNMATKCIKLEKCVSKEVCEEISAVCELNQLQTSTLTLTMTTDMTHEARSAWYTNLLSVGTLDNRDYTQSDESIQTLTSSQFMHNSEANSISNSNTEVKLAYGT